MIIREHFLYMLDSRKHFDNIDKDLAVRLIKTAITSRKEDDIGKIDAFKEEFGDDLFFTDMVGNQRMYSVAGQMMLDDLMSYIYHRL